MKKQLTLPGVSCDQCSGELALLIQTKMVKITELKIKCQQCGFEENILEKGAEKFEGSKKELQRIASEMSKTIIKLGRTLPKNKDELGKVVTNPKHPFTAALLSGLVIWMMELSGFGIFMAVTWILGNLILNPIGWVLIPVVVAVAFGYRGYFTRNKLARLKEQLKEIEQRYAAGDLTGEEYEAAKDKLLSEYFK